jgi:hypothetical protein
MTTDQMTRSCALATVPLRCPPVAGPFPGLADRAPGGAAGSGRVGMTNQTAAQRRAVTVLGGILERAAVEELPPCAWTVAGDGAVLVGRFEAFLMEQRCDDFNTWRLAVGAWANRGADVRRDHADRAGTVRLVDQWERFEGVTVTLMADIYADD